MSLKTDKINATILAWLMAMTYTDGWGLILEMWEIPLTMSLGSFGAGFSAVGGGTVAFPVFTKILAVSPQYAK